jgi:hypothetical protein
MTLYQLLLCYAGTVAAAWVTLGVLSGLDHAPFDPDLSVDNLWELGMRPLLQALAWPMLGLAVLAMLPAWAVLRATRTRRHARIVQERLQGDTAADRARKRP